MKDVKRDFKDGGCEAMESVVKFGVTTDNMFNMLNIQKRSYLTCQADIHFNTPEKDHEDEKTYEPKEYSGDEFSTSEMSTDEKTDSDDTKYKTHQPKMGADIHFNTPEKDHEDEKTYEPKEYSGDEFSTSEMSTDEKTDSNDTKYKTHQPKMGDKFETEAPEYRPTEMSTNKKHKSKDTKFNVHPTNLDGTLQARVNTTQAFTQECTQAHKHNRQSKHNRHKHNRHKHNRHKHMHKHKHKHSSRKEHMDVAYKCRIEATVDGDTPGSIADCEDVYQI